MGISQFIKDKAMELGFSACGIAEVAKAGSEEAYFDQWIAEGVPCWNEIHGESSGNSSQSGWLGGRCQISYLSSLELLSESYSGIRRNLISRIMRMEKIITGS